MRKARALISRESMHIHRGLGNPPESELRNTVDVGIGATLPVPLLPCSAGCGTDPDTIGSSIREDQNVSEFLCGYCYLKQNEVTANVSLPRLLPSASRAEGFSSCCSSSAASSSPYPYPNSSSTTTSLLSFFVLLLEDNRVENQDVLLLRLLHELLGKHVAFFLVIAVKSLGRQG